MMSYESLLFLVKRLAGIPGYQLDIDNSKEYFQRQIFTPAELHEIEEKFQNTRGFEYRKNLIFDGKMHVLESKNFEKNPVMKAVDDEEFKKLLNDSKFHQLSMSDKFRVKFNILLINLMNNCRIFKNFFEFGATIVFYFMKRHAQKLK